jgi:hypothetical protein
MLTISTIMGQLPVFHKLKLDEFADFIDEFGFNILEKERVKDKKDMMALLYIVGEKTHDNNII